MKQHINLEQLKQLEDIPETLYLFNKKYGLGKQWYIEQLILRPNQDIADAYLRTQCKEINIGKMIEILNIGYLEFDIYDNTWLIGESVTGCHSSNIPRGDKKELCDALWDYFKHKMKA